MPSFIDLTNKKFGRLTALYPCCRIDTVAKRICWVCICECGDGTLTEGASLRNGRAKSCGCLQIETRFRGMLKHGCSRDKLYIVYKGIKARCYNPQHSAYKNYGGRGVTIDPDWLNSYEAFKDWSIQNGYVEDGNLTIDRVNNDEGYSPENCRWVTRKVQSRNTRRNRFLEIKGTRLCVADWAKRINVSWSTLYRWIESDEACAIERVKTIINKGEGV